MSTPAGWYPQPDGQQRYWDGQQWSEEFAPGTGTATPVTTPATGGEPTRFRFTKKHIIGYAATALVALVIGAAAASSANSTTDAGLASDRLPVPAATVTATITGPATTVTVAGPTVTKTVTKQAPAKTVTVTVQPPAAAEPAPGTSSCEKAREAILTGSHENIVASMQGLIADKTAPSVAREYARYYVGRDAGQKDMQEMDIGLIQMACS